MKNDPARTVLGYLAAFTLGIICTAVLFVSLRKDRAPSPADDLPAAQPPPLATQEPPRRQSFQRLPRPALRPAQLPPSLAVAEQPGEVADELPEPAQAQPMPVQIGPVITRADNPPARVLIADAGRISGKVRFLSEPPPEISIPLDPVCSAKWRKLNKPAQTQRYVVGKDRGLADVVVSLQLEGERGQWNPPQSPLQIIERNCSFEPYVSAILSGQPVIVQNSDKTMHTLHLVSAQQREFNRAQLPGRSLKFEFKEREDFARFSCDVHPWEFAYLTVFDHPFFAVTDRNGVFAIQNVPPGKYTLQARHRKAGTLLKEITLESHRNADVQFDFQLTPPETVLSGL